jgi:type VI secretion system protein ImpJ
MFLRPQHFQAAQRYLAHQAQLSDRWDVHYNWGLRSVEIDREALANHRLAVRSLRARLRDGTLLALPEDGDLPELDLRGPLERDRAFTVLLALPALRLGRANVTANGAAEGGRYLLDSQPVEDENTGDNPQPLELRLLNVRLLLSTQGEHAGYELLPLARVGKSADADTAPQLDATYIPPVLACDAWAPLQLDILRTLYDRIGTKIDLLAGQVATRGITVESHAAEDARIVGYLRALNEAYALLGVLVFAEGVHPLHAYLELCRLVGQLAIFGADHRPPELPRYDHDDLGRCFYAVKQFLDSLLDLILPPHWEQRDFVGAGLRIQVPLEPAWLEPSRQMFVGVQSPLPAEHCVSLLTTPGQLDMKIGSSDRVDQIFKEGLAGLRFTHTPQPPRALPTARVYFQINREAQPAEWQKVRDSLTLAIRLNEHRIAGSIQGEKKLTIRHAGQTTTMQFTLFVVRPETSPKR